MIGSGYHEKPTKVEAEFFHYWYRSVARYEPDKIVVICDSGCRIPLGYESSVVEVPLDGNLGYCGDLLHGSKTGRFSGGPAVLMALAALAYADEADLAYVEQDCLTFGDCIAQMYAEIHTGGIIFGHNTQKVPCENCMFLLKHEFILEFLATYATSEPENKPENICERKFQGWHESNPKMWRKHTIPGGRDRPLPYDAKTFYCQKITSVEMRELASRDLLELPENVFHLPE